MEKCDFFAPCQAENNNLHQTDECTLQPIIFITLFATANRAAAVEKFDVKVNEWSRNFTRFVSKYAVTSDKYRE